MAAARGRDLGDDIQRIVGTSLDKGVEMDALAKLQKKSAKTLLAAPKQAKRSAPAQHQKTSQ